MRNMVYWRKVGGDGMSTKIRQDQILEILEKQGFVTVKYLSDTLHYSTATINRDLNSLQKRQLVSRTHGGVEAVRSAYVPILFRTQKMRWEKRSIGRIAASFVKDGDTIFIDGSTTAQCMEEYLVNRKKLTVVTNNILLAVNLSKYKEIRVISLGGEIVEQPCMLCGRQTVENAEQYRVDKMFFSTGAVSADGKIASGIYDLMLRAVAKNAKEVFYLVDHKKIDQPFSDIYCDFSAVDRVISDYPFGTDVKTAFPETDFVTVEKGE
ncbi:MAG: DeoR/GlpR transcriptional regulator [Ruminococcaceae bacterium]|nr:DeoR/GlpR transcriptional regulator [Oscillospiraceae bacterium]